MPYTVYLRKNATGEVRACEYPYEWDAEGSQLSWWTAGNYSCDCNRELEFERAGGAKPRLDDVQCSTDRFTLVRVELPDGTVIPID